MTHRCPAQGGDYVCPMRACRALVFFMIALLSGGAPGALRAQECTDRGPLGLVLSGGGAKGLAHIGVLRVLDSLGVRPDFVVGTSMGSIVGAMYASGYTASQIATLADSLGLAELFTNADQRTPRALGDRRPLVVWEQGTGGFRVAQSIAREAGVNAALNRALLRGNLFARGSFDSLPIPFRAVATDLRTRAAVVLESGDLARAVRASMAIPLVFDPVRIEGRQLVDGGLAANVPIGVARAQGAARLIVSDVSWRPPDSVQGENPLVVADLLVSYLFTQPLDSLGAGDLLIRPAVDSYQPLDFGELHQREIRHAGYEAARAALEGRTLCGAPPQEPRQSPLYHVTEIGLSGGRPGDETMIRRQLRLREGDDLEVGALRDYLTRLAQLDEFREVWLRPTGPADALRLDVLVRTSAPRVGVAGVAYDNDLGGQMWVGGVDRGATIPRVETSGTLVLGELRQELALNFRTAGVGRLLQRPLLGGMIAREEVRVFNKKGGSLPSTKVRELSGIVGAERRFGREWLVEVGGMVHTWHAEGGAPEGTAWGGVLQVSSGPRYRPSGIWAQGMLLDRYRRVEVEARRVFPLDGLRFTPTVRYGWGRDLPVQRTFPLGGVDGFPGLNVGERRGDREVSVELLFERPLFGPLSARVTAVSGQVATGGPAVPRGRWQTGGRVGVGAATPIGQIRVEYGITRDSRNGMFVRLGEWF